MDGSAFCAIVNGTAEACVAIADIAHISCNAKAELGFASCFDVNGSFIEGCPTALPWALDDLQKFYQDSTWALYSLYIAVLGLIILYQWGVNILSYFNFCQPTAANPNSWFSMGVGSSLHREHWIWYGFGTLFFGGGLGLGIYYLTAPTGFTGRLLNWHKLPNTGYSTILLLALMMMVYGIVAWVFASGRLAYHNFMTISGLKYIIIGGLLLNLAAPVDKTRGHIEAIGAVLVILGGFTMVITSPFQYYMWGDKFGQLDYYKHMTAFGVSQRERSAFMSSAEYKDPNGIRTIANSIMNVFYWMMSLSTILIVVGFGLQIDVHAKTRIPVNWYTIACSQEGALYWLFILLVVAVGLVLLWALAVMLPWANPRNYFKRTETVRNGSKVITTTEVRT